MASQGCGKSHKVFVVFLVMILYFILGKLALLLAMPGTNAVPVWPPAGLALAAALRCGYFTAIGVFFSSFFLNLPALEFLSTIHQGSWSPLWMSLITGSGAALQAMAGAFFIYRLIGLLDYFSSPRNALTFSVVAILSCLINSNIGVMALCLGGFQPWSAYFPIWWTWWVGDALGVIVITPFILAWATHPLIKWPPMKVLEASAIIASILVIAYIQYVSTLHISYLFIPFLIWAATSFNLAGATLAILLTTSFSTLQIVYGSGPFSRSSLNESLLLLALYIIIISSTILALVPILNPMHRQRQRIWYGSSLTRRRIARFFKNITKIFRR